MAEPGKPFTAMTAGQKLCVPVLILLPIVMYFFPGEITVWAEVFVYLIIGAITRCLWPVLSTLIGAIIGLGAAPAVNGNATTDIRHLAIGASVGLLVGLVLQLTNRIPRQQDSPDDEQTGGSF